MMGHAPYAAGHAPYAEAKVFKILLERAMIFYFYYHHEICNKIIEYFRVDFFISFDLNSFSTIIDHNSH